VIAVDPANPARVIAGGVNLFVSTNSATTWNQISDWTRYAAGDRNQYADHHAVLFDRNRADHPNRVWIANDGGVSSTDAVTTAALYPGWRKRSYGINAAQFYDVTVHPTLPFLTGGGLQDNGTYLSYGGFTWYQVDSGDGGSLAYTSNPRLLYGTSSIGLDRLTVGAAATLPGTGLVATTLPDVAPAGTRMRSQRLPRTGFPAANGVPFIGILEGHPTSDHHLLVGRVGRAFRSVDGNTFTAVGPALAAGEQVTAMSFLPGQPSTVYWFATNQGRIFRAGPVAAPALVTAVPWPGGAAPWVHRIAFAAAGGGNFRVAVCSAGNQGELFVADIPAGAAAAVGWQRVTAGLPPGPFLALAFEPADPTRLFVGTFAGVYGCSDLPAFPIGAAAPAPTWQTFNAGLPIVIAHDLAVSPVTRTLRCATFGRGVFERELNATPPEFKIPAVGLLIRNHLMDDGRPYAPANTLANDPRQGAGVAIDDLHSFDIRVDAPRFQPFEVTRFGEPIDGGEFDETMVHDSPIAGEANVVYVQVQNRGNQPAHNAQVHLFFAAAPGPAAAPDLQAGFRAAFSGNLPAGGWQRAAPAVTVGEIGPGQPAVARFEWTPPLDIGANAALLAITTADPGDKLDLVAMPAANDVVLTLVRNERRAAVRITPVVTDPVYIRDGVDDDGSFGAVAWGGRSPDIAVLAAAPPADVNTNAAFTDLDDPRRGDRVQAGANQVIVRVFNRSATAVAANVDLFRAPLTGLDTPSAWVRLSPAGGVATPVIPARSWRFTAPVAWNVTDAATTFVLVALASPVVAGGPPKPDTGDVHNLETLWRFLRSGTLADKAAMRALRRA
ncbi:MAG TPA: hypothetical protein VOA87_17515, partial [Thermoanaerobaculia bacterium]|nr:hypothetical protein [Thermoanaerobaculia bacterium]